MDLSKNVPQTGGQEIGKLALMALEKERFYVFLQPPYKMMQI